MNTDLIKDVRKIKLRPSEAVVIRYNSDKANLSDAKELHDYVAAMLPDNKVLSVPDYVSLWRCSKEKLENIIEVISEIKDRL